MIERSLVADVVTELHAARIRGDLQAMCRLFAADGRFEIAGATADKPIAIKASGLAEFRPWLGMMVKMFRLSHYALLSTVVEAPNVVAHWRADIHSKVTGLASPTELIDLVVVRDGLIMGYREFFVPR